MLLFHINSTTKYRNTKIYPYQLPYTQISCKNAYVNVKEKKLFSVKIVSFLTLTYGFLQLICCGVNFLA